MNFFKSNKRRSKSRAELSSTHECHPQFPCEDLPHNMKASRIILKLSISDFKPPKQMPFLLKPKLAKSSKRKSSIKTLAHVNNYECYSFPVYSMGSSKSLLYNEILPHRYGVECNDLHRIRTGIKNRPKLRRLVISLHS